MLRSVQVLVLAGLSLPHVALAVTLTEIAWMGSTESANHEWIELYTTESIDVTDWTISDGVNFLITLDGVLPAGAYSVLERSSDQSAAGIAWQIYTGSLINAGATLTVRDPDGGIVDRVIGGEDWELIGGDNTTKDTAQLVSGQWRTAPATPGSAPANTIITTKTVTTQSSGSSSGRATAVRKPTGKITTLTLPDVTLQLAIDAPEMVYVNQPVPFIVTPSGVGDTIADSLQYTWNLGEGNTTAGTEVTHSYTHPGNYVVVVEGAYKRQQQFARHEIVVLPVAISLAMHDDGSVAIQNTSQTEIDIADYRLVGADDFTFPDHTILLPQSQIVIAPEKFSGTTSPQMIALYDQADQAVAVHTPAILRPAESTAFAQSVSAASSPTPRISAIDDSPAYRFVSAAKQQPTITVENTDRPVATPTVPAQAAAVGGTVLPTDWPRYWLLGVLLLAILAVYLVPRREKDHGAPWA